MKIYIVHCGQISGELERVEVTDPLELNNMLAAFVRRAPIDVGDTITIEEVV